MLCSITALSFGQAVSVNGGAIQGSITDASGAVVPNASVVIKATDTGSIREIKTDASGYYSVGPLNSRQLLHNNLGGRVSEAFREHSRQDRNGDRRKLVALRRPVERDGRGERRRGSGQHGSGRRLATLSPRADRRCRSTAATSSISRSLSPASFCRAANLRSDQGRLFGDLRVSGVSGRTTRILLDGQDITDETVGTTIFNVSQAPSRVPAQPLDAGRLRRSDLDRSGAGLDQLRHQQLPRAGSSTTSRTTAPASPAAKNGVDPLLPAQPVRRQRRRTDHQGQAVLLRQS